MTNYLKFSLAGLLILSAGIGIGRKTVPVDTPDFRIEEKGFVATLDIKDDSLITKFGYEDARSLFVGELHEIYGDLKRPELKTIGDILRLRAIEQKIELYGSLHKKPKKDPVPKESKPKPDLSDMM